MLGVDQATGATYLQESDGPQHSPASEPIIAVCIVHMYGSLDQSSEDDKLRDIYLCLLL